MLGLCHDCFATNVEVFITKGRIHCRSCENPAKKEEKKEEKGILKFEDLPQAKPEERSLGAYRIAHELFEKEFMQKLAEDRQFDKGY